MWVMFSVAAQQFKPSSMKDTWYLPVRFLVRICLHVLLKLIKVQLIANTNPIFCTVRDNISFVLPNYLCGCRNTAFMICFFMTCRIVIGYVLPLSVWLSILHIILTSNQQSYLTYRCL